MKKITLLLCTFLLTGYFGLTQSQRMVLAEESTSSTCGPCGQQNPGFDALLQANEDIATSIKYHVWWPAPGNDPMYHHNPSENAARTDYYGINSVPRAVMEGNYYNGAPANVTQNMLNTLAAVPSPFEIQIQQELSPDEDSIFVTTLIHATDEITGNMVAQVVVIEKHIAFSSPPGTNGEKDFYNVMKKFLPGAGGTSLPSSMESGDYVILQNSWKLENVYDNEELAVVAFVQNNVNKDIHQAGNSSIDPLIPIYMVDAELLNVTNATSANCSGSVTPFVTIRNNGGNELTSLTINYSVNGGEVQSQEWTGSLSFLETEVIELSEITFDVEDINTLTITGIEPNGGEDDYVSNNTFEYIIDRASVLTGTSIVFLKLDDHPEETTWEIKNSAGEVVQSGGPYEETGQEIELIEVTEIDCYEFIIYDEGGNGTDYYAVVYGNNVIAFEGGDFGDLERNEFSYGTVSIDQVDAFTDMSVYPNPAHEKLNINFYLTEQNNVEIRVIDLVGKIIVSENHGIKNAGPKEFSINTSNFISGIYLLEIEVGNDIFTQKISIN